MIIANFSVYSSLYHFPLEGRSDVATEAHYHLLDVRAAEELLSVLHA